MSATMMTVGNGVATAFGFVTAGLTSRSDDPNKGSRYG
jgi:hypothetical protein